MIASLLASALLLACLQEDALPDAAQLLDAYRAGVAEPGVLERVKTFTFHGRVAWDDSATRGFFTEVYGGPRRARITSELAGMGRFEEGTDGELVWERSLFGVEIRGNWDACESLRQYGIAQHRDWRELYEDARCVERAEIEGRAVWVLHLFPRALVPLDEAAQKQVPPPDVWYLAVDDGLPLRIETRAPGLLGEPAITRLDLADWQRTDGIAYPRTVRLTISGFTLRLDYQSVRHDAELAPGFFAPDEEILAAADAGTDEGEAVRIETVEPRHLAAVRVRCAAGELQSALAMALPEAMQRVVSTGATVVGAPLVVYHSFGETHDIEAAIPIAEPIEGKGRVQPGKLPGGAAVVTWHRGPYERLGRAHERVMAYLDEHGLERRGAPWEEYWTDPGMEPDPAKWRTKLVWPIVARPTARASADDEPPSGGR